MSADVPYLLATLIALLVIGGAVVWTRRSRRDRIDPPPPVAAPLDLRERIREMCAGGQRVQAIRELRAAYPGLSLLAAKQMVDGVAAGGELRVPGGAVPERLPPGLHERILSLGEQRKIQAIKLLRDERPGLGLKQAKDAVEAVLAGAPPAAVRRAAPPAVGADLAGRVRGLRAAGEHGRAVSLVREETGMSEAEAAAFVESIDPEGGAR